jgi:uncharacterized glyoxalase superfamily protein PhnB/2'-5' RNA ligase
MTMEKRRQLSLFVPPAAAVEIEALRRILDPVQHGLIPAHITLCREDEIEGLEVATLRERLQTAVPIGLDFDPPEAFSGHGWWLAARTEVSDFSALRLLVLGSPAIRVHKPHLTLAHPRNPRAPGNQPANVVGRLAALSIRFDTVSLIEQEGRAPWRVLETFRLGSRGSRGTLKAAIPLIHVRSTEAAAEFLDRLGFRVVSTLRADSQRPDPGFLALERDGVFVHVSSFAGDGVAGGVVAFWVDDVDALFAEFQARGVAIHLEPTDQTWGNREMYVKDSDGNCLRFLMPVRA